MDLILEKANGEKHIGAVRICDFEKRCVLKQIFILPEYQGYGYAQEAIKMPIGPDTETELDLTSNPTPNQEMPLLVSTKGRCLWSEEGFHIRIRSGVIEVPDSYQLEETGGGLREAYLHAMQKHFPFRGMPAENLFGRIIYNTWIELTYHQNEEDILAYAGRILESCSDD